MFKRKENKQNRLKRILLKLLNIEGFDKETFDIVNPNVDNVSKNFYKLNDKTYILSSGFLDLKRKIKQVVCIDLELGTDISSASKSDNVKDTLDYKAVAKTVKSFVQKSEFLLIEALAEETVKLIFKKFNVTYIKGRFSKPGAVTGSKEVGVIIERNKSES